MCPPDVGAESVDANLFRCVISRLPLPQFRSTVHERESRCVRRLTLDVFARMHRRTTLFGKIRTISGAGLEALRVRRGKTFGTL
jgi:hypothetical protein